MKLTLSLFFVLFGAIGTYSLPHGQYLIFPPNLIHQTPHLPLRERVLLYPNNLIPQVPAYYDRSGLVHIKTTPDEAGYVEQAYPSNVDNTPAQDMQPPVEPKVDPVERQPVPQERQPADAEARDDSKGENMARIELEPEAEYIPDSIPRNSPPAQPEPQPQAPAAPYPGLLPGRRFYFVNGPQFVTYPQYNPQYTPQYNPPIQPTFRYPSVIGGYPQQFYVVGQPTVQTQPGQTVFLVNDPSSQLLRSNQVQKIDVPALGYLRQAPIVSTSNEEEQKQNVENENDVSIKGRIDSDDSEEEKSDVAPATKSEDSKPKNKAFSSFLEQSALKKANDDNEAIVIEADKNAPSDKVEIVHSDLKSDPSQAKSAPNAVAIAGEGGSAQSAPKGSAIAGPAGLAVSSPTATALAGDYTKITNKSK